MRGTVIICPPAVDVQSVLNRCRQEGLQADIRVVRAGNERELERQLRALSVSPEEDTFTVGTGDGVYLVRVGDILLCRAQGHRFRLWLRDGRELLSRTTRRSFARNTAALEETGLFLHAGATVLVNVRAISVIQEGCIQLCNGLKVPFPPRWQAEAEKTVLSGCLGRCRGE